MSKRRAVVGAALAFAVLAALVLLAGCTAAGELSSSDMAKIGETIITKGAYETRLGEIEKQYAGEVPSKEDETYADFQKSVLAYMVDLEVIAQSAATMNISVTEAEVTAQIDGIKQMYSNDEAAFQQALAAQNLTLDSLQKTLRENLLNNRVYETVTKDATVTEEQIQAYYDENPAEFMTDETRTTRHILFAPGELSADATTAATEADWSAALQEATKVRSDIVGGADFGEMAKQHSDDPGSKDLGGDLGEVQRGMMVPEFEEACFSLDKLAVSEPIKTAYGYHLIQVTDITAARQKTLDEVRDAISATLLQKEQRKAWDAWLAQTKKDLGVVVKSGWEPTTTTVPADGAAGEGSSTTSGATTTTQ